jgi:hypothetical protein
MIDFSLFLQLYILKISLNGMIIRIELNRYVELKIIVIVRKSKLYKIAFIK